MDLSCPVPHQPSQRVLLSHGGGARHSRDLLKQVILKHFGEQAGHHDGAYLPNPGGTLVMTTDSYVIQPLFFPGGNIGSLAVCGTLNDLAVCAARPLGLTVGFILEEGLDMDTLERIVIAMNEEAKRAGVSIVSGDTKVIERGRGDGLFINVSGVGQMMAANPIVPENISEGDVVIVNGDIGRHGLTIMATREGLDFETSLESDSAAIWPEVEALLDSGVDLHCMRDLTRGGLGMAMYELSGACGQSIDLESDSIPVHPGVSAICEVLGLDPLFSACEGRFAAMVPEDQASKALAALEKAGARPKIVGQVGGQTNGSNVVLRNALGVGHILVPPSGEQLPRIC